MAQTLIAQTPGSPPSARELRESFDRTTAYSVGLEDEVMLLDPSSYELSPRAPEVLALLGEDSRFKLEMPASQLEILTRPAATVDRAAEDLLAARHALLAAAGEHVAVGAAGVHPSSPGIGVLNDLPRYEKVIHEHGIVAQRQLVCALQVHIGIGDADAALAVYNAARSYLPLIAALAANAPFYEGRDTGLASVRPKLCELLPRQGVPPALSSWSAFAQALAWGASTGTFRDASSWWWELRPHPRFGTLEFRVPDAQTTVADAAAVAAVVQALVAWLAKCHASGEPLPVQPTWQLAQNRWSACRHGIAGMMADADAASSRPTRILLERLLATLEPIAARLGSARWIVHAHALVERGGPAAAQRAVASERGVGGLAAWLAERFVEQPLVG